MVAFDEEGGDEGWVAFLGAKLDALELERDVYVGYVSGLMESCEEDYAEGAEQAVAMMGGAAEQDLAETFADDLVAEWRAKVAREKAVRAARDARAAAEAKKRADDAARLAAERTQRADALAASSSTAASSSSSSTAEQNAWIARNYGKEVEDVDDDQPEEAGGNNKAAAAAYLAAKRGAAKQASAREKDLVKKSQQNQKALKEAAAARKTVKQERKPRG